MVGSPQLIRVRVAFCRKQGISIEKLALQYSIHHEAIPTTLVSTADPKEILQNIAWASEELDWDLIDEIPETFLEIDTVFKRVEKSFEPVTFCIYFSGPPAAPSQSGSAAPVHCLLIGSNCIA